MSNWFKLKLKSKAKESEEEEDDSEGSTDSSENDQSGSEEDEDEEQKRLLGPLPTKANIKAGIYKELYKRDQHSHIANEDKDKGNSHVADADIMIQDILDSRPEGDV